MILDFCADSPVTPSLPLLQGREESDHGQGVPAECRDLPDMASYTAVLCLWTGRRQGQGAVWPAVIGAHVSVCVLQVRIAGAKGNKAQTLYTTDSYVVSLAAR